MNALGVGLRPGSNTSHLAILGYDIERYYTGRGTIEVAGLGMGLEAGDVALRGNLGTVDNNLTVMDRRAGRITDTGPFVKDLDGLTYEGVTLMVRPGTGHRAGIILRGPGLSFRISNNDPHETGVRVHEVHPLDNSPEAAFTARVLNHFLAEAHRILAQNPLNQERVAKGLPRPITCWGGEPVIIKRLTPSRCAMASRPAPLRAAASTRASAPSPAWT